MQGMPGLCGTACEGNVMSSHPPRLPFVAKQIVSFSA